jgi:hypothetical protein
MTEQQQIDSILAKIKARWRTEDPLCVFCCHGVDVKDFQLAHLIRRSESIPGYSRIELQTMELNIGAAHFDCHDIFDNSPELAVHLPNIHKVIDRIKSIDENYYNRLMNIFNPYWPQYANCETQNMECDDLYLQVFVTL